KAFSGRSNTPQPAIECSIAQGRGTDVTKPGPKYSSAPLAEMPDEGTLGPAMLALTEKQRRFVLELRAGPKGYGSQNRAARAAGYIGDADTLKVTASRVTHSPAVQAALKEIGASIITAAAFQAIGTIEHIAANDEHPDQFRAARFLVEHAFPIETSHR